MVVPDALFDTNILIDHLNSIPDARRVIASYNNPAISIMTWIEVITGADTIDDRRVRDLLSFFLVVSITPQIAEESALIRRASRLKLPDGIILATARVSGCALITRNTRDFDQNDRGVHIPYRLDPPTAK